ncbi:MAG: hypothetical protein IPM47_07470 [Sphingobacteriales bacterium]|nr:MAG: hypothetical protein IPM47_07470 [Sphingobacteriales bacterium]
MAKNKEKKNDFFWLSYSDLMTSLFFVMLVLFVLVYSVQNQVIQHVNKQNEELKSLNEKIAEAEKERKKYFDDLKAKAEELERIKAIDAAILELQKGGLYEYNTVCKRFELKQDILFEQNSAVIPKQAIGGLIQAGKQVQDLLQKLKNNKKVKFIIVIEGRAAKHENARKNLQFANNVKDLGYSRSLSLFQLWESNGIKLNDIHNSSSEVFISSSGFDGLCRYSGIEEGKNKRFIIQIIPYLIQ